ncbi:MAG: carboxypeptidase regulatory-like domain-containing protein, partial [Mycobacterium sp.]
MSVDPSDDCTFFYTQEYYLTSTVSGFDWATSVAKFAYPGCVAAPRGTVSGIVTLCGGGGPLAGALVSDGLGHIRVTDAAGAYSMDLPPGPYTLTITKQDLGPGGGPIVITNGATTTLDACLAGVPGLAVSSTSITAESCLPGNGVLDPGEVVTVSFCLQNTGNADAADLLATLAATGGVVDPPAPVDFGVVSAGGPSVCRSISFTVDPAVACGAMVTASLGLADGASNLGTAASVFQTGIPKPVSTQSFDSVAVPALPAGWVATNATGPSPLWSTTATFPDTAPNAAYV